MAVDSLLLLSVATPSVLGARATCLPLHLLLTTYYQLCLVASRFLQQHASNFMMFLLCVCVCVCVCCATFVWSFVSGLYRGV
jgi:hypothetical protein